MDLVLILPAWWTISHTGKLLRPMMPPPLQSWDHSGATTDLCGSLVALPHSTLQLTVKSPTFTALLQVQRLASLCLAQRLRCGKHQQMVSRCATASDTFLTACQASTSSKTISRSSTTSVEGGSRTRRANTPSTVFDQLHTL